MKSKRRHHSSSEESEESDCSDKSSSSSDTESEDSSEQEHRHKKKKKRADSSESESDSDVQKRSKKRKHKKKSKKHGKKKRRSYSEESESGEEPVANHFRLSDGEISPKKKRKHKHKHNKRARSSSSSVVIEKPRVERRLHSVVKGRRASSEENSQPSRTYYQKEYHPSAPGEDFEREREVQRFYRGSSKERRHQYEEQYQYNRERNDRHRYEEQKGPGHYHRRQRQDQPREDTRGFNRYNQYEDRSKRDYDDGRDYRERRGPPETDRYRQREYPDPKREKYREERYSAERVRDGGARDRPVRDERPPASQEVARSRSGSQENRYREKWRKEDGEGSRRRDDRPPRSEDRPPRDEARSRPPPTDDNQLRKRKSRFADASDNKEYSWGKTEVKKEGGKTTGEKEKPNFGLSGKLTADQNTVNGVVIKYTEPEDAKQPKRRWRFYPFKGDKALPILYIHRQSAFLLGRDKKVADIPLEHPSVSKQHAALQYRATPFVRNDGTQGRRVRPYIIDLDSANGTFVNNKRIEPRRYVELLERDVVKFGFSQREYVLLHENSKDDALDDDQQDPGEIGAAVTTTDQIKHEKRIKQEVAEDGE